MPKLIMTMAEHPPITLEMSHTFSIVKIEGDAQSVISNDANNNLTLGSDGRLFVEQAVTFSKEDW